jgi:hypothetical protein
MSSTPMKRTSSVFWPSATFSDVTIHSKMREYISLTTESLQNFAAEALRCTMIVSPMVTITRSVSAARISSAFMPSTSAAGVGDARGLALRGGIAVEVDVAEVQQAGEDLEQGALLINAALRDALQDGRVEVGELRLVVDLFDLHAAGLAWILAVASCRATMHASERHSGANRQWP